MELGLEKEPLVDRETQAFIFSLVSALGGSSGGDDGRYVLGDDALAVLRDIKRWLRLYDDKTGSLDVARLLADSNLVKGDLLEILAKWPEAAPEGSFMSKIALLCVDLLTQLTWPIDLDEKRALLSRHHHIPSLQKAQAAYKQAILHHDACEVLRTVVRVGLPAMAQPQKERSPTEENIIKVVLYFFRNVALIAPSEDILIDDVLESDISRSATVEAFQRQDIFSLLLTVCSSMAEDFSLHDVELLDILYHLVKGLNVERLFMEKEAIISTNTTELRNLISKEKGMLAGYARHAPSRHNRFGTMLWVKRDGGGFSTVFGQTAIANEELTMADMDRRKAWKRPARPIKKDETKAPSTTFDTSVILTTPARKHLRKFVEHFLDSSFNPLFTAVRRTIEREADRVLDIHKRQYLYLISWFLRAESARRKKQALDQSQRSSIANAELEDYSLVASVLDQETFVLLNRLMQTAQDEKHWQDLDAGMKCFTQILYTVQDMFDSPLDADQEIAENILNRIFYEKSTHDRVIGLLRSYNNQNFSYLDACTELAHVFLRLLERYSKQNVDMQIRSRRRARKKRNTADDHTQDLLPENEEGRIEAEDVAEAQRTTHERRFDFTKFASQFVTQASVNTYVAFLRHFKDLNDDQLKRSHRFFYRVAFKMNLSIFLFRLDIIALMYKLIKGPESLNIVSTTFKDWEELVRQVFRKLAKRMQDRPALDVEILFSKINSTMFYLEHGYEVDIMKKIPRAPMELEVKPGMDRTQQIGVATSVLINQSKLDILAWLKEVLSSASAERKAWEDEISARKAIDANESVPYGVEGKGGDEIESKAEKLPANPQQIEQGQPQPPSIPVQPRSDEHKAAMRRDKHVRLMMTLLGFLQLDEDVGNCTWIIPSGLNSLELSTNINLINRFEFDPPEYENGKSATDYLRRKAVPIARHVDNEDSSNNEADSASELDHIFPVGGPTARHSLQSPAPEKLKRRRLRHKRDELLDSKGLQEKQEAKRKIELERQRKIKSALMVHASDDESDEERDRVFFAMEEERRRRTAQGLIITAKAGEQQDKKAKQRGKKRKVSGKIKEIFIDDSSTNNDDDNEGGGPGDAEDRPKKRRRNGLTALMAAGTLDVEDSEGNDNDFDSDTSGQLSSCVKRSDKQPANVTNSSEAETEEETPATSLQTSSSRSNGQLAKGLLLHSDAEIVTSGGDDSGKENADVQLRKPTVSRVRRRMMAGFIVDSDSE